MSTPIKRADRNGHASIVWGHRTPLLAPVRPGTKAVPPDLRRANEELVNWLFETTGGAIARPSLGREGAP